MSNYPAGVTQDSFDRDMEGLGYEPEPEDGVPAMNFNVEVEPFYVKKGGDWVTQWSVEVNFVGMEGPAESRMCKTRAEAELFISETIMNWAEARTQ